MSYDSLKEIKNGFEKHVGELARTMIAFPWEDKRAYATWCAQTYYYVCHSTRLLALGAARCAQDANGMHRRFVEHLEEEKGHEHLASNDVRALGFKLDQFPELPSTSLFYQNQYYWLNTSGAVPFFGWILSLEGVAVKACGEIHERVKKAHGQKAAMFLKVHSEEDVGHLDKAFEQLSDLDPISTLHLLKNMEQSCMLYSKMLEAGAANAEKLKAAA